MTEWCWDWYGSAYYSGSPAADPRGPTSGTYRVLRGGSWGDSAYNCRVARRSNDAPGDGYDQCGFRCVKLTLLEQTQYNIETLKLIFTKE